jgi:hypothetical protein
MPEDFVEYLFLHGWAVREEKYGQMWRLEFSPLLAKYDCFIETVVGESSWKTDVLEALAGVKLYSDVSEMSSEQRAYYDSRMRELAGLVKEFGADDVAIVLSGK